MREHRNTKSTPQMRRFIYERVTQGWTQRRRGSLARLILLGKSGGGGGSRTLATQSP